MSTASPEVQQFLTEVVDACVENEGTVQIELSREGAGTVTLLVAISTMTDGDGVEVFNGVGELLSTVALLAAKRAH